MDGLDGWMDICQDYTSTAQGHQAHKTLAQATKGKVSEMEERWLWEKEEEDKPLLLYMVLV